MAFVDFLLFFMVVLVVAAVVLGYAAIMGYWSMRRNNVQGVQSALKGAAVPVSALGGVATFLSLWAEVAWPLPAGNTDILFFDVTLLFGATLLVLGISMAYSLKLQYAGLFALIAGGFSIAYGYTGWQLGLTKEPFELFLLYAAFGGAGIFAFPATVAADHYLASPAAASAPADVTVPAPTRRSMRASVAGAVPPLFGHPSAETETDSATSLPFRLGLTYHIAMIAFIAMIALAAIAALSFVDSTLPAHLLSAP